MKNRNFIAVFFILLIFTISSCTITKRHYKSGYYVDWHIGKMVSDLDPDNNINIEQLSVQKSEFNYLEIEEPVLLASDNSDPRIEYYTYSGTKKHELNVVKFSENKSQSVSHSNSRLLSEKSLPQKQTDEPIIHWTAGAALGLGLLGFIIPFFPCIAAIVFGIVALNKINSEPDKYKGRGMAIAGIVLGALGIVFIIGLAALMILALG